MKPRASEFDGRWRARLPLALVLLALASLAVFPLVVESRLGELRREVLNEVEPARDLITEIQLALTLETAGTRTYLLTGDAADLALHEEARRRRQDALARLLPFARRLGPALYRETVTLARGLQEADALLDALAAGRISQEAYTAQLPEQQRRLGQILEQVQRLDRRFAEEGNERREAIERTLRLGTVAELALVLLGLLAALEVARLSRRSRQLAGRLALRAWQQEALKDAARELGRSLDVDETVKTIATCAVATTEARGAYVERTEEPKPGAEVEVVAVAGEGGPPLGTRIPYPGSLTEELIESGEPALLAEIGAIGERMAPYLRERCRGCAGLVIPLLSEGETVGTLVLLRGPDQAPFTAEDATHARALGDLASAALRRVLLLERLRESEARFRQITDHLHQVIWLGEPDLSKRYFVNPAYEEVWGRSVESFFAEPRSPLEHIHPEDRERVEREVAGLIEGQVYESSYRIVRPDGEVRWIWSRGYPIRDERGGVYRAVGIMEDITEVMQAEAERERLRERERAALAESEAARAEAEYQRAELTRVTESRTRLIRGFSHDVKNPLSAADLQLQLLERGRPEPLTERQQDRVEKARRSIQAALGIIADLLDLARAEASEAQVEIAKTPLDLRRLILDVAEEHRAEAEAKGLAWEVSVPDTLPPMESDERRIRQILGNLLSNAVKYTQAGTITVRATLPERAHAPGPGAWIALGVTDTGPGIAPEQQRFLFKEFRRLQSTQHVRGSGIGLSISQRLAHALGGDITVESAVGVGSTFTLWLPF